MDMINIFCINTLPFKLTCVQIQFKGPLGAIGRLLNSRLSNMKLKLEIKDGLKKCVVFLRKCLLFLFL